MGLMAIHLILAAVNEVQPNLVGSVDIYSDCLGALESSGQSSYTSTESYSEQMQPFGYTQSDYGELPGVDFWSHIFACEGPPR